MKEATHDFHAAFELNAEIAETFVQVRLVLIYVESEEPRSYISLQRALVLSFQRKYSQIIEEFNRRSKLENIEDAQVLMLVARARVNCGDNEGGLTT